MYTVKKLGKHSQWDPISLFDKEFHFIGPAIFQTLAEAQKYLKSYSKRIKVDH